MRVDTGNELGRSWRSAGAAEREELEQRQLAPTIQFYDFSLEEWRDSWRDSWRSRSGEWRGRPECRRRRRRDAWWREGESAEEAPNGVRGDRRSRLTRARRRIVR